MTNKEAIETLNNWDMACPICEKRKSEESGVCIDCRFSKAIDLAIKALEQEPKTDILEQIIAEINTSNRGTCDYYIVDRIEEIINEYQRGGAEE